ncbi:hypothetical protein RND71_011671 [Anisodus tanguticus]|uniref:Uncharacterized protein n=1 Tax=Anisodus tanguticus TaxID=243964 RepID=A0AAE1SE68_9SOLA|nr:hypothetical protein RND71_011671 [Anisodus tanguticus]
MEDVIVVGGEYYGEWVETSGCWIWHSRTKVTVPIEIQRSCTYKQLVESTIESDQLKCSLNDVPISYTISVASTRGKIVCIHKDELSYDLNRLVQRINGDAHCQEMNIRRIARMLMALCLLAGIEMDDLITPQLSSSCTSTTQVQIPLYEIEQQEMKIPEWKERASVHKSRGILLAKSFLICPYE